MLRVALLKWRHVGARWINHGTENDVYHQQRHLPAACRTHQVRLYFSLEQTSYVDVTIYAWLKVDSSIYTDDINTEGSVNDEKFGSGIGLHAGIWLILCSVSYSMLFRILTQAGRVGHWYAGLVLLNNHPSQHIHQSVPMPLPLIQVAKAPHDKKFERQVRMQGRTLLQQMSDKSSSSIHWRGDFSCSAEDETSDSPRLRQHPCGIPEEPGSHRSSQVKSSQVAFNKQVTIAPVLQKLRIKHS